MSTNQAVRPLTTGEEESLSRYYVAYQRYPAMRLLVRYEDSRLLARLPLAGKRVLEMGCGSLPVLLGAPEPDFTYVGTDLSESGLRLAQQLVPHGEFIAGDAMAAELLPGPFDFIIMKNLLHHLERPEDCLRAARQLLAPGGMIVVLEPNSTCVPANLAKALLGLVGRSLEESPFGQLKVAQLQEAFRASGFDVSEVRHSGLLAFPLSGDYGSMRLLPQWVPLWRGIIALDRMLSTVLLPIRCLGALLAFKVIFHLKPNPSANL